MKIHPTIYLSFIFCFIVTSAAGQTDTTGTYKTRNGIWFTPTKAKKINGVAIGPFQSDIFFDKPQSINGLSVNFIGFGILIPLIPQAPMENYYASKRPDTLLTKAYLNSIKDMARNSKINNGVNLSLSGDLSGQVNGISVSAFCGFNIVTNGIMINPLFTCSNIVNGVTVGGINIALMVNGVQIGLFNKSIATQGIQIGLFNKTTAKGGLQIGLWNTNRKRSFPLINWCR